MSSVVEGFEDYRLTARRAIEAVGGEPILVNEDFPARNDSARNTCLDAIGSCDAYIVLIGSRGGWRAPSGKLVVEEEYERARELRKPIFVFLQSVERTPEAERLAQVISHYVDGRFRVPFSSTSELEREIRKSLEPFLKEIPAVTTTDSIWDQLKRRSALGDETALRAVIIPERHEEVIDPLKLRDKGFRSLLYRIGHEPEIALLNPERAKSTRLELDSLTITQTVGERSGAGRHEVSCEVRSNGRLIVEANVTGRMEKENSGDLNDFLAVQHDEIRSVARSVFAFHRELFKVIDEFHRHMSFLYNVALVNLGLKNLVAKPLRGHSATVNIFRSEAPMIAFSEPRIIVRGDLAIAEAEIERLLSNFVLMASGKQ